MELEQRHIEEITQLDSLAAALKLAIDISKMSNTQIGKLSGISHTRMYKLLRTGDLKADDIITLNRVLNNNVLTLFLEYKSFPNKFKKQILATESSEKSQDSTQIRLARLENDVAELKQQREKSNNLLLDVIKKHLGDSS